jgi:hypothetical protein
VVNGWVGCGRCGLSKQRSRSEGEEGEGKTESFHFSF